MSGVMNGVGNTSRGTKRLGHFIGSAGKNTGFLLGVLALTLGDLLLGQNFYQTMLDGIPNDQLVENPLLAFVTTRFLVALFISALFSAVQMIGINMIIYGVRWKTLEEPGHKFGFILVWSLFAADFYFNFGGAAVLLGGVKEGSVLPLDGSQPKMVACFFLAVAGSFGLLFHYMFLGKDDQSETGEHGGKLGKLLSFGRNRVQETDVA